MKFIANILSSLFFTLIVTFLSTVMLSGKAMLIPLFVSPLIFIVIFFGLKYIYFSTEMYSSTTHNNTSQYINSIKGKHTYKISKNHINKMRKNAAIEIVAILTVLTLCYVMFFYGGGNTTIYTRIALSLLLTIIPTLILVKYYKNLAKIITTSNLLLTNQYLELSNSENSLKINLLEIIEIRTARNIYNYSIDHIQLIIKENKDGILGEIVIKGITDIDLFLENICLYTNTFHDKFIKKC